MKDVQSVDFPTRLLRLCQLMIWCCVLMLGAVPGYAQGTAFTYQGQLKTSGAPANGAHDFEFKLYDAATGGSQLGANTLLNISVTNGVFTVPLNFGSVFGGEARYLEISARPAGAGAFTPLTPRQLLTATPYALHSATATNALQLGGLPSTQYAQTNDARLSDERNPKPGSTNYIQNTTTQQPNSNFNISGNGLVNGVFFTNNLGVGVANPQAKLHLFQNSGNILMGNGGCNAGFAGLGFATTLTCTNYSLLGNGTDTILNRPTGGGIYFRENNVAQMSIQPTTGNLVINNSAQVGNALSVGTSLSVGATALVGGTLSVGNNASVGNNLSVGGTLAKGGGSFKIDHPLDPENKYLYHSFVESPDMMNIYNGVVTLGGSGEAEITLPDWFEALNSDFRYQLTAIGRPGPNLYVAEEVKGNRFKIAGGVSGQKVSWQVTGIRQDAFAKKHRIPVEELKRETERGTYLHPEAFGQPAEKSVNAAMTARGKTSEIHQP